MFDQEPGMAAKTNEQLKAEYTDKKVSIASNRPELARFQGRIGRVVTVNQNNRALVDFQDGPWYDIPLDELTLADN